MTRHETNEFTNETTASASKSDHTLVTRFMSNKWWSIGKKSFASPFLKYLQEVASKKTPQKLFQSFFALHAKAVLGLFSNFFNQGDTC